MANPLMALLGTNLQDALAAPMQEFHKLLNGIFMSLQRIEQRQNRILDKLDKLEGTDNERGISNG